MSLSPVRQQELCRGLLLPSEDKLSGRAGKHSKPEKRNGYLQPAKRALGKARFV